MLVVCRLLRVTGALAALAALILVVAPGAQADVSSSTISTANYPLGIDIDSAGNVWIGYADGPMATKGVTVVPSSSGTIFGQAVTAGVETRIFDLAGVQGVLRTSADNLFVSTGSGSLYVATPTASTVFGVSTTPNTLTLLNSGSVFKGGLAMDSAGNLFGGRKESDGVGVLPVSSGTLYGVAVTANTASVLVSSPEWTGDVAVDSADNLLIGSWFGSSQGVHVLPKSTGTLYGVSVTQNVLTRLVATSYVSGIDVDSANNLYYSRWSQNEVSVVAPATRSILGQTFTANVPTVLVGGSGDQGLAVAADGTSLVSGGAATVRITSSTDPGPGADSESNEVVERLSEPDVVQQIGRKATSNCAAVDIPELDWAGVEGGWTESWAEWAVPSSGGFVCTRTLHHLEGGTWLVQP